MTRTFESLSSTIDTVWERLERAPSDGGEAARTLAFATARPCGGAAVRMLVLRAADRRDRRLELWTNGASRKVEEIRHDRRAELLFWDAGAALQVRIAVEVALREGDPDVWSRLGDGSRANYARAPAPGDDVTDPDSVEPKPDPSLFKVISAQVERIETLWLGETPHRRAVFPGGALRGAKWIAP